MVKALELEGQRFNRLLVVSRAENTSKGQTRWKCTCDCGNTCTVICSSLVSGKTKSCGCLNIEKAGVLNKSHGMTKSPEYQSWRGMKERCDNPKNSHFKFYGERGISYDPRWSSFDAFLKDMGERPVNTQLDREDVNKGYYRDNCRLADLTQQAYNIRKKSNNRSGRTGVYFHKQNSNFMAVITHYKVVKYLGVFETFEEACKVRESAELELYGYVKE